MIFIKKLMRSRKDERDILLVKNQIEDVEKKIYIAAGAIAAFVFLGQPAAQKILAPLLEASEPAIMERTVNAAYH